MPESEVLEELARAGVIPVVELDDPGHAVELVDALAAGGIAAVEITFRTAAAASAIREIARARPEFLVGAGTVVSPDLVAAAVESGARFAVSPGFGPRVSEATARDGLPYIPGVASATDIQLCLEAGHSLLKLFPVEPLGGLRLLRALAAPFAPNGVRFMPTGGISPLNLAGYLAEPSVACVGGSWIAARATIARGDYAEVTRLAGEATREVALARSDAAAAAG
jgi:2-dehydro-3-deoxyphosphogluconate aldolase/(4S)-4-hydroxy-2-oxoglutarate aldolase